MRNRLEALQNALLFDEVPEAELQALTPLVRDVALKQGETFAVRGQPLAGMVLLEEGALEVLLDSSPICTLSPGSVFCEDALVTETLAPATLRAASASRLGQLERGAVLQALGSLPHLRHALEMAWRRRILAAGLYQIDLFQALTADARAVLLERFEQTELPDGTILATEGQPGDAFLFIRRGEAQLHIDPPPNGPEGSPEGPDAPQEPPMLRVGDYLNDSVLIDDSPQTATVSAKGTIEVMRLTRALFEDALSTLPGQLDEAKAAFQRRSEGMF